MKYVYSIIISVLVLLSSCKPPTDPNERNVTFSVHSFSVTFADEDLGKQSSVEVRILGNFNDWAGGTTNNETTWAKALPLSLNYETSRFEGTIKAQQGEKLLYTFIAKCVADDGTTIRTLWIDPSWLHNNTVGYFFTPIDNLVDNGMDNGGYNVEYYVP